MMDSTLSDLALWYFSQDILNWDMESGKKLKLQQRPHIWAVYIP